MFCIEKMQITSIYGVHTGAASGGAARFFACLDEDKQACVPAAGGNGSRFSWRKLAKKVLGWRERRFKALMCAGCANCIRCLHRKA